MVKSPPNLMVAIRMEDHFRTAWRANIVLVPVFCGVVSGALVGVRAIAIIGIGFVLMASIDLYRWRRAVKWRDLVMRQFKEGADA